MENSEIEIGKVIIAKAGRDQGRTLVILKVIDKDFVLVVDGDLRRIEKPKLKKVMHCALTKHNINLWLPNTVSSEWDNASIRKALKDFTLRTE